MPMRVTLVHVRWDAVPGATGYAIHVDGKRVATAGPRARTTRVTVDDATLLEILPLPALKPVQAIELTQELQP